MSHSGMIGTEVFIRYKLMNRILTSWCCLLGLPILAIPGDCGAKITKVTNLHVSRAIAINDRSDILVVEPETGELSILNHDKLEPLHQRCAFGLAAINNQGDILFNRLDTGNVCVLNGGHIREIHSIHLKQFTALSINDTSDILVNSTRGVSIFYDGVLHLAIPKPSNGSIYARAINNHRNITGYAITWSRHNGRAYPTWHAFFYARGHLTYLKGASNAEYIPYSISNNGVIVGECREGNPLKRTAVLWLTPNTKPIDLNTLLPKGLKIHLQLASSINSQHQVVVQDLAGSQRHSYLLSLSSVPRNAD